MDDVIKTSNLCKYYGPVKAVNGISLNVSKGEIYGFLGINGAGKTTTIRMLLGMVSPTKGEAYLLGEKVGPNRNDLWAKVGYIVESPHSYPDLTVKENLEITLRLRQLSDQKLVENIIERLKLTPYRDRKAKNLSTGNAQRLGLAKALMHSPEILLLDEPANGLDPAGIAEIRELLVDLAFNQGITIFLSSHILSEIAKMATRIGIIHQGKLIQEVDRKELEHLRQKRLLLNSRQKTKAKQELIKSGYSVSENKDGKLIIRDKQAIEQPDRIASSLVKAGCPPTLLQVEEEDLESYFLRLIGMTGGDVK